MVGSVSLIGAASVVFVVRDVLRAVEHYREFVDDVDALYDELKSRGARTLNEPKDYPYGESKSTS